MSSLSASFHKGKLRRESLVYRNIQHEMSKLRDDKELRAVCRKL